MKNNISKEHIICEKIELKTPVTKAEGFARINSNENVLFWTKKLLPKNKYSLFQIKGLSNSYEGWAEGTSFDSQNSNGWINLFSFDSSGKIVSGIPLVNKTKLKRKNIGNIWYTTADKETYAIAYGKLFLDFEYVNNTINVKLTAKATAANSTFLGWTKTQTKFYFKIIIS
ncbi:hypothetical protein M1771_09070 [Spiroplasma citri]|uniref:Uncharacterized protein n=1 Tax=Spiroplasma citri TaxID=2133 RepID=A0AAX3SYK9_SPICI|nr:hypothetical protein [Spiroplasma citri]WFG96228.1 hypothetical protein M0C40_09135 [Spiroplasma citri]WFH00113.1 hypothetical protein M1771_09070 [Spiroplasma citri]